MKKPIAKGKYAVLKKNGNIILAKKADKGLLIELPDNFEVTEKTENKLTKGEKEKLKTHL